MDAETFELTELYSGDFGTGGIGALNTVDIDNDGDLDVVVSTESEGIALFEQVDNFMFESLVLFDDVYDADVIDVVNLNNDGIMDFVL